MLADVGHLTAWLALIACVYAAVISALGAQRADDRWVQSGRVAAGLTFPLLLTSAAGLWLALLTHDFGIKYVASVSSLATPTFFRITALWGSQNGSILFWCLLMSLFIFFAMNRDWDIDRSLLPYVTVVMSLVLAFFIAINLTQANPFVRSAIPPADGNGLNPLLRHPGMIIHPPVLYAGFTGFIVPFAFCLASLAARRTDNLWLLVSRRWTLVGWVFLSAGLLLGGRWAHDVLGWGGYWGWDPVENKSFVPWLLGTAFLHSAMVQEKRGMLKNWNVFLMLLTFISILWSTAVVRSGVLTSVHAFAQSNLGPLFLGFIVITCIACITLWFTRIDTLTSDRKLDSPFSREGIFILQNFVFLSSALTVFIGTTLPLITEAITGDKLTVGPPFYDKMVVPQLLLLVFLMGIAPIMAYGRANWRAMGRMALLPAVLAGVVGLALVLISFVGGQASVVQSLLAPVSVMLCVYTLVQTLLEYWRGTRARQAATGEPALRAFSTLARRNPQRYGGYLVHLGIVVLALGAIGKGFFGYDVVRNVDINDSFVAGGYSFTYRGLRPVACGFDDCGSIQAGLRVTRVSDGSVLGDVFPQRDVYDRQQFTSSIADITGGFNEEVYVILSAWEGRGENASFQVYINPMINWVWLGGIITILGFCVAFWPQERGNTNRGSQDPSPRRRTSHPQRGTSVPAHADALHHRSDIAAETGSRQPPRGPRSRAASGKSACADFFGQRQATRAAILMTAVACALLLARPALGQSPAPANLEDATYRVAKQLNCPTCAGRNLADCPTETCTQWKTEIREQLQAGKSQPEVLNYFEARFGGGVLQEPPRRGITLWLWLLPLLGLALLLAGGITLARRSAVASTVPSLATPDEAYARAFEALADDDAGAPRA